MGCRISAVINTFNEEKNISYALRSVRFWVDEIIIVDMYSTDNTVNIAREFGAKIYFHERVNFVEPARAFAVSKSCGEWVLVLDADEVIPEPLSRKLKYVAYHTQDIDVVRLHRLNYIFGSPMNHTGWGPHYDKQTRFFRRGFITFSSKIHDLPSFTTKVRVRDIGYEHGCAVVHFNYLDVSHFLEKLNRYTTIEASQLPKRVGRFLCIVAAGHAAKEFLFRYVKAQGYRDGWRGFYLSLFMALYRLTTYAKLTELSAVGTLDTVQNLYRAEAEKIVSQYR